MKILKFKVRINRDATAGSYEFKVKYYTEGSPVSTQTVLTIDIENEESAEIIYIDQVELIPGKITPLTFTINNVGSTPLRDLSFYWENEDDIILPVGSDNTKYVKYIDVGESAKLKFDVIASANADPDLYKLDLSLIYNDPISTESKEVKTKAGVYVGGATDFDVAYSGSASGESSFSISNIGSVAASSVTVRIPDQKGWSVTGSNSVIIGNLNEGDYTIASFALQSQTRTTDDRQLGNRPSGEKSVNWSKRTTQDPKLNIDIEFTDSRGNRNTISKDVTVDSSSLSGAIKFDKTMMKKENNWLKYKWWIIGAVVLIVFVMLHKKFKKGKMKDPDYSFGKMLRGSKRKR